MEIKKEIEAWEIEYKEAQKSIESFNKMIKFFKDISDIDTNEKVARKLKKIIKKFSKSAFGFALDSMHIGILRFPNPAF